MLTTGLLLYVGMMSGGCGKEVDKTKDFSVGKGKSALDVTFLETKALLEETENTYKKEYSRLDKITKERGLPKSEYVFPEWKRWLEKETKKL